MRVDRAGSRCSGHETHATACRNNTGCRKVAAQLIPALTRASTLSITAALSHDPKVDVCFFCLTDTTFTRLARCLVTQEDHFCYYCSQQHLYCELCQASQYVGGVYVWLGRGRMNLFLFTRHHYDADSLDVCSRNVTRTPCIAASSATCIATTPCTSLTTTQATTPVRDRVVVRLVPALVLNPTCSRRVLRRSDGQVLRGAYDHSKQQNRTRAQQGGVAAAQVQPHYDLITSGSCLLR